MSATQTLSYITLELLTPSGPQHCKVSVAPPHKPTADEIPVIDLSTLDGDYAARKALSTKIKAAAENTGFFYVKNHGVPETLIHRALDKVKTLFSQPLEEKEKISCTLRSQASGYHGLGSSQINRKETRGMFPAA